MDQVARLPLGGRRWQRYGKTLRFVGVDLTGADLRMQLRLYPNAPGAPLVDLVAVTNGNAEGLRLVEVDTSLGVPVSIVAISINETTMEGLPFTGEAGEHTVLAYDLQIDPVGRYKSVWAEGEFWVLAAVTGADGAELGAVDGCGGPRRTPPSFSPGASAFQIGDSVIELSVGPGDGPPGATGPRGRDVLDLAWREEILGVVGQSVFDTAQTFLPDAVDVLENGIELLRSEFTLSGNQRIILDPPFASDGVLIVKAFHTPNGSVGAFSVDSYGAKGDGVSDDTAACQACIDAAPAGAVIEFTAGKVYRINPNASAPFQAYGGLHIARDGQILHVPIGAEIKALPSPTSVSSVINAYKKNGWRVTGGGKVTGERDVHPGQGGEFGHGITAFNCDGFEIDRVEIAGCWGDGITLLPSFTGNQPDGNFNTNFRIHHTHIHDCRRNGISPIAARDGEMDDNLIHDCLATAPAAGIDCEPDLVAHRNARLKIRRNRIYNVQVGIEVTVANDDILITENDLVAFNSAVLVASGGVNIVIDGNPRLESTVGGSEGGSVRFIGGNAKRCIVTNNDCYGGGVFLLESLQGDEVHFRYNRLNPTNTGCAGFARILGPGSFEGNVGRMAANTGVEGVQFIQLNCQSGRNSLFYDGTTAVGNAIMVGTDVGGDYFGSARLKRPNGSSGLSPGILKAFRSINASVGGIGPGSVQVVPITGLNCLLNTVIPFADGNGEAGADRGRVDCWISDESATGCNINIRNGASATQSVNLRLIISSGA